MYVPTDYHTADARTMDALFLHFLKDLILHNYLLRIAEIIVLFHDLHLILCYFKLILRKD